jgi:chemotaxis protein MotB
MIALGRRSRHPVNVWPAFVDALASLLLVFIFVVLMFVLGHVVLTNILSGRDRALDELGRQVSALAETLSLERARSDELQTRIDELMVRLQVTLGERDAVAERLAAMTEKAEASESEAAQLRSRVDITATLAAVERERVDLLNQQVAALREQLALISAALELSEARGKEQKVEIAELGKRLNIALARKVDELQRYRSEFFGRLREVLGDHPDIRIVGDRFVFQSEVLFPTASATLVPEGERQLAEVARTLKAVTPKIPAGINWVLQIDGHTDRRPIKTAEFRSNWELSTARALSVVNYLIGQGIPARRLAAAGFGEYQPLDTANTPQAWARNRRIEIKFTQP